MIRRIKSNGKSTLILVKTKDSSLGLEKPIDKRHHRTENSQYPESFLEEINLSHNCTFFEFNI